MSERMTAPVANLRLVRAFRDGVGGASRLRHRGQSSVAGHPGRFRSRARRARDDWTDDGGFSNARPRPRFRALRVPALRVLVVRIPRARGQLPPSSPISTDGTVSVRAQRSGRSEGPRVRGLSGRPFAVGTQPDSSATDDALGRTGKSEQTQRRGLLWVSPAPARRRDGSGLLRVSVRPSAVTSR